MSFILENYLGSLKKHKILLKKSNSWIWHEKNFQFSNGSSKLIFFDKMGLLIFKDPWQFSHQLNLDHNIYIVCYDLQQLFMIVMFREVCYRWRWCGFGTKKTSRHPTQKKHNSFKKKIILGFVKIFFALRMCLNGNVNDLVFLVVVFKFHIKHT